MTESRSGMRAAAAGTARQMSLDLPAAPPRYDVADFIRSDANEDAWRAGLAWLAADEPLLTVCGPAAAGKTHFVHALCENRSALYLDAADIVSFRNAAPEALVVVDDMPAPEPEAFLASLEQRMLSGGRTILIGRGRPADWAGGLKDLRTRIEAAPRAALRDPDEALIRTVLAKGFRDRQVTVSPAVIEFAAPRLPRTFAAARAFVAAADRAALEEKRKITTPMAQKILDNLFEDDPGA